jgi:hypothetical protein
MGQKGIVSFYLIICLVILLVLIGAVFYLGKSKHSQFQPLSKPSSQPTSTQNEEIKIIGIYEMQDHVVVFTNKPAYGTFYHWLNPASKTETYLSKGTVLRSNEHDGIFKSGFGYQIKVYEKPDNPTLSQEYTFEGNRQVVENPDCTFSNYNSNNCNLTTKVPNISVDKGSSEIYALDYIRSWNDNIQDIQLETKRVYLATQLKSPGNYQYADLINDNFVVVEVSVKDLRGSGDRRSIEVNKFFRLVVKGDTKAPVLADYLFLAPQEDGTTTVIFGVKKDLKQFVLENSLDKNLKVANQANLDFNGSNVLKLQGLIEIYKGFSQE